MGMPELKEKYFKEVVPQMMEKFGYKNIYEVPRIVKITINVGCGLAAQDNKYIESTVYELGAITGQRPKITRAKKSIAGFRLRAGQIVGAMVTLRGDRMYEFLYRLINIALPRVRDFRGLSPKGFDGRGNYNLGIREQIIFPEINYDKIARVQGMNVSIVTTAKSDEEAYELLRLLGMPFRQRQQQAKETAAAAAGKEG